MSNMSRMIVSKMMVTVCYLLP